nr:MAG TPA: hypothetical protein [Caudoviricetes sp.]
MSGLSPYRGYPIPQLELFRSNDICNNPATQ